VMHLSVTASSDRKRRIPADVNRLIPRSTPMVAVSLRAVPRLYFEGDLALHVLRQNSVKKRPASQNFASRRKLRYFESSYIVLSCAM
jgi:hypothetical protein